MSLYDYTSPPEPEFSDAEWDLAHFQICSELIRDGYTRAEALERVDDLAIYEQAEHNRRAARMDAEAERADALIKRRKEEA